jgi:hypothetical protein
MAPSASSMIENILNFVDHQWSVIAGGKECSNNTGKQLSTAQRTTAYIRVGGQIKRILDMMRYLKSLGIFV